MEMTETIENETEERAIGLFERLVAKEEFHNKKWDRARKWVNQDFHYKKMRLYSEHRYRAWKLVFRLRNKSKFGDQCVLLRYDKEAYVKRYAERILEQKEEGKRKFETTYKVGLWFFSESLRSDYGTHECDKCNSKFHHSPCTVYLGSKKEYSSCCGYCANEILRMNRQKKVYH